MIKITKKIKLSIIYLCVKTVNTLYIIAEKLGLYCIGIILFITTIGLKNKYVNICTYLLLGILGLYISSLGAKKVNNVLSIDNIGKQINMNISINIKRLNNNNNRLAQLNSEAN